MVKEIFVRGVCDGCGGIVISEESYVVKDSLLYHKNCEEETK